MPKILRNCLSGIASPGLSLKLPKDLLLEDLLLKVLILGLLEIF